MYGVLTNPIASNFAEVWESFRDCCDWLSVELLLSENEFRAKGLGNFKTIRSWAFVDWNIILFSHDICTYTSEYYIPDELVKDMDQTPTKYLATSSVTMAGKNTKLMPKQADNGKRAITANFWKFLLSFSEANWTNEQDTFRKISNVLLRTFVGRRKS